MHRPNDIFSRYYPNIHKSPLVYAGGKTRAIPYLMEYVLPRLIGNGHDIILSPFFGGGSFELALTKAGIGVVGSDIYRPLTNFWEVVLSKPDELYNEILKYYPCGREQFYYLRKVFKDCVLNDLESAGIYYVLNRHAYSGIHDGGYSQDKNRRFNINTISKIREFRNNRLKVLHADYKSVLEFYPSMFAYLDPPYAINRPRLYPEHEHFNHFRLFETIKNRDNWILSYNDCPLIRSIYKGFRIKLIHFAYSMSLSKPELLIFAKNLPIKF